MTTTQTTSISTTLVDTFSEMFVNHQTLWFKQWVDSDGRLQYPLQKPGGKYYRPIDHDLIREHLSGRLTISFPAMSEQNTCKWLCFDSDEEDGRLDAIEGLLIQYSWLPFREGKRPGRDGHLWLFFSHPIPAVDAVKIGKYFVSSAGLSEDEHLTVFPKSPTSLSQVRAPLGFHNKPGANCFSWFDDCPTKETIPQLEYLAGLPLVDADAAMQLASTIKDEKTKEVPSVPVIHSYSSTFDRPKITASELAQFLPQSRRTSKGYVACCPAHNDSSPSLTFWDAERAGKPWLAFKCFAGCSNKEIWHAFKGLGIQI